MILMMHSEMGEHGPNGKLHLNVSSTRCLKIDCFISPTISRLKETDEQPARGKRGTGLIKRKRLS